jgi:CRISPR/Cas system-associated exonuclease Cas4 (RecB family)
MPINIIDELKKVIDYRTDEPRKYIGASGIGHPCLRKIWYQYKGIKANVSSNLQITFDIGHRLETLILDYLGLSNNVSVEWPNSRNENHLVYSAELPIFQGHMDAIITYYGTEKAIIDIKTAKASSFARFRDHGLRTWNEQYYAQLQSYMGMTGINEAVLLALNKDDSNLHEEWLQYDAIYYQELVAKAEYIAKQELPPEPVNKSPLYIVCKLCQYKGLCHG